MQEWAKAPPEDETMEMDLEKPTNGYTTGNLNVDTSQQEETALAPPDYATATGSANPFTAGQTSNPFRQ